MMEKSNQEIKEMMNTLPGGLGLYHIYRDGKIELIFLNDDYYDWIGLTREERSVYQGDTTISAIYKEDHKIVKEAVLRVIKENVTVNVTCRIMISKEAYRWVNIRIRPISDDGEYYTVYALYSDVDELMNAKELLNAAFERVKESETSLQTMLKHMPGAMVVFEVHDHMLYPRYISEGCKKISGFTARETIERNKKDPLADAHPNQRIVFKENEEKDIKSGKTINYKYQILCKDGSYKWVNLSLSPVIMKGELLYYGVLREFDADEFELMKDKNRYQQFISNMEDLQDENLVARARIDLEDNKVLYYLHKGHGKEPKVETRPVDDIFKVLVSTVVSDADKEKLQELLNRERMIKQYKMDDLVGSIEYQRTNTEGNTLWYSLKYTLMMDPDTRHIVAFIYIYDVTARILENHMMVKLGEEEYDVLGLIDVKTKVFESKSVKGVKSFADSHNMFLKGDFEEIIKKQIQGTVHENERKDLEQALSFSYVLQRLEKEKQYEVSFSAYRKNQTFRRKKMNFCYLDDSKTYIFYYCIDVTDNYNKEQEQLKITEEALENARLANASKTEFVSRMSHDMRTPMNGILGLAELSEDETDIKVLKENIHKIKMSGEYLLDLINDTLDFQRIESGKLQLEPSIVNCNEIFSSIMDMLRPSMEKKKIDFRVNNRNVVLDCYINVDPVRMRQIFINLVSNAIKFTPEGGIIRFEYECMKREGMISHNRFVLRDTGIGMSEEFVKHHLFQPFAQEHNEVTGQYAGSGLGLSIVKRLVDLMGGRIEVQSELGVGTTFTIYLDFERVDRSEVEDRKTKSKYQKEIMKNELEGTNILLVEDHPLNAEITIKLLEKVGCQVTWVNDGKKGVEAFEQSKLKEYQAILMDIRMPVLDGMEASSMIRILKREDAGTIPIIAMTANAYDEDARECMAAGMNAHLAKPINPSRLYRTLLEQIKP